MKIKSQLWMTLFLLILMLTACQADQENAVEEETVYLPQSSSGSSNQAYPAQDDTNPQNDEAYPVQNEPVPQVEVAYPISTQDLQLLNGSWFLYGYQKDGIALDPASKTLTFSGDVLEISTEDGTIKGTWSARIDSPNPILILDTDSGTTLFYEIITLDETTLTLQTSQDQSQIIEEYMPAD